MRTFLLCFFALLGTLSHAQGFYDLGTIQTIEITFAQSNWDQLLDNAYAAETGYIMAQSVTVNGVEMDSIGVKYKGNSTYQANQTKNPFHIELDTYKDHSYDGYTDIKLSNVAKDPSFLREVLSYQVLRQYMDAPLSNYANVFVNGTLIGLYSNSESISRKFVDSRFGSKNNTFVKCNPPAGAGPQSNDLPRLVYLGTDSTNYYDAYEIKSDGGWAQLINLCDTLANQTDALEDILDVDRVLWMHAFNNVLINLDSYSGQFAQNYYLYRSDYGQFLPVVWDLNESFGRFSATGNGNLNGTAAKQRMDHLLHQDDANYPLIQKLLAVPMYKRMYLAHMKTMVLENFDNGQYEETGLELQTVIDAAVQADQNKFFTYNNFLSNLTSDISGGGGPGGGATPGIVALMSGRADYLLGLADFNRTEPEITDRALSTVFPIIGEELTITATVTDAERAFLGFRTDEAGPFTRSEMFDDGAHGDGGANDGVYGLTIDVTDAFTQYYIYAENDEAGKFSPVRAEHEFHTITATTTVTPAGDLVINEFMASNDVTQADQDGEFDDWIELYNNSNAEINLEGYTLSDDGNDLAQWAFPAGTVIPAGGYLIVWADDDEDQEGLHANFKLSAGGESLFLVNASGTIVDEVTFTEQETDSSYGRFPSGTGPFRTMTPTFNGENSGTTSTSYTGFTDLILVAGPNPVSEFLNIRVAGDLAADLQIRLVSVTGQTVRQTEMPRNGRSLTLDVNGLPEGVYFLAITDGFRGETRKVVVRR